MHFNYFSGRLPGKLFVAAGVCAGILAASAPASADTFSVQYFHVATSTSSSSDFHAGNVPTGTTSTNYVLSTLSGGMPVYNTTEIGAAAAHDVGAGNVLEWWTPGTHGVDTVVSDGTGNLAVGSTPVDMFPPDSTGTSNANAEETAILTGTFSLGAPGSVNFSVSADDDAFVFIDGNLVEDLGGIHGIESATFSSGILSGGSHTIQIFYADQDEVAASLAFTDGGTTVTAPTPEPGSLALLGTGILAIGGTLRRRMMR
jgi:fibro-slime domain-containing protein